MKRLFSIPIIIVSLLAAYEILSTWKGVSLYETHPSKESLLRAIELSPSNPDPFYRLGLFYQWDIRNGDLKESYRYLRNAIDRNPLEQQYYLNLARVLSRMGEKNASEQALEKAILVFPTSYQGRWVSANLLLQQGAMEKAISHFSYILANYPNQAGLVYDVLAKAIQDMGFILEKVVPKNPFSMNQYLAYLYEIGDRESAKKAWEKKASYGIRGDRRDNLRHIEFLISRGDISEAHRVWNDSLREEGLSIPSDGNLVTNGGFEKKEILGGGFDWRITGVPGVEVSFDHSVAFEGRSSLRIDFNGKENVDFRHVYQFVPLKPNTEYVLRAHMKTKAVTTKSGLRIEISGVGPAFHKASESLIGDSGWKELVVTFRTPPQSQGGVVRIKREKTDKFDRYISGSVWIDNVSLAERHH
ncbi:MAG: carbohydrate binding domain-containing protein [Syntrophaceae bacterium]|nr:carbohydrate binding domain-containing protein [Syntrophaceae bacterium]